MKLKKLESKVRQDLVNLIHLKTETESKQDNSLRIRIEEAINKTNRESNSDTPDFILAQYLIDCLNAYDKASRARDNWYGVCLEPGNKFFYDNEPCATARTK